MIRKLHEISEWFRTTQTRLPKFGRDFIRVLFDKTNFSGYSTGPHPYNRTTTDIAARTWRRQHSSGSVNTNNSREPPMPGEKPVSVSVESRRKKLVSIEKLWPGATIVDVTSKGVAPWVRFSPFFPHGGIPIPNTPTEKAQSVEGLWQGLKVFEVEDIDPGKWAITGMSGIKRGGKGRGAVRGHRFGVGSDTLLGYRDARFRIYLPAYKWVLENRLVSEIEQMRRLAINKPLVLLDYESNADVEDVSKPLSHAALVMYHLEGSWPTAEAESTVAPSPAT